MLSHISTKKILVVLVALFALLFLIHIASAYTFTKDTVISQNNINFHFPENLTIDSFRSFANGMILDGYSLYVEKEGGEVDVFIYHWNGLDDHTLGIQSNALQQISFRILGTQNPYYFFDGETYYLESFDIPANTVINGSFVSFGEEKENKTNVTTYQPVQKWYNRNLFTVVISSQEREGIIYSETKDFTYLNLLIGFFVIAFVIVFLRWWFK